MDSLRIELDIAFNNAIAIFHDLSEVWNDTPLFLTFALFANLMFLGTINTPIPGQ
jgi:hypothetical protein